jgi:glycosyl transferase family 1
LFRPASKADAKRRLGYEGKFVILADARNHRRKMISRALDIISRLDFPTGKLVFHLHTNREPQEDRESYQYDVQTDIELLKLESITRLSERDFAPPVIARLYQAADVHLLTSFGEGFGLPTLQAASTGVVPIAPANSASTELVGRHGFAISCDSSSIDEFGLVRHFIDREKAVSVLHQLSDDPGLLHARSTAARRFAIAYDWDRVVHRWDSLFRQFEKLGLRAPNTALAGSSESPFNQPGHLEGARRRPTGHSQSILPLPRIGVPTRVRPPNPSTTAPIVLAEASCVAQLQQLERLFPRLRIEAVALSSLPAAAQLAALAERADLVVDPREWPENPLDLICALRGVSFLGKSRFWLPVPSRSLLLQARFLLTDYAAAERRILVARQRALSTRVDRMHLFPEGSLGSFIEPASGAPSALREGFGESQ